MKKYLIAVAALGFLAACSGKANKNIPVEVEEESVSLETVPVQPATPVLPVVKEKPVKAINMRDSLKVDPKKGAVVQKKYKGTVPAADGPGIVYDLTLYYQQDSDDGVYELDATYLEAEDGKDQTFSSTGKRKVKKGVPTDASAVVYELIPSDGSMVFYFQAEGDSLTMLNQELQKAASDLNYTLTLVQ
ncbi:copper resistance protein NlpE [Parabacteroides sp. AM08-6]|uniref:copper resistance protein NlpE n=1 Tax=Parabacteroides sp. AM08-6 TaxID=2292053 RepID=UPI000F0026EC|nr:copper resistance protein NlpE [Parabacteroides sp. AM08-6]RHJ84346.1 copper resistance protein NlpE [Parabacteroides sp. AM08-6]